MSPVSSPVGGKIKRGEKYNILLHLMLLQQVNKKKKKNETTGDKHFLPWIV